MRRPLTTGLLMGLILTFLSWMATLVAGAYPGGWVGTLSAGVEILTFVGWFWLGWRLAALDAGIVGGAMAGLVSGLVIGILVAVPQEVFMAPASTGHPATFVSAVLGSLGAVVASMFLGGVVGLMGGSAGKMKSRAASFETDGPHDTKGD